MVALKAPSLLVLWFISLPTSTSLVAPVPKFGVAARSSPATSALAAVGTAPADAVSSPTLADASRRATEEPLTEFQEFVKRRQSGAAGVLLDLRPSSDFCRGHLVGATSIPADELEPRLLELPPPFAEPVSIVGNEEDLCAARELLTKKGWQVEAEIRTDDAVTEDSAAWPTETGPRSVQAWRANDFLEFCMERYLLRSACVQGNTGGSVLDLGCGSGRDTVYMAQQLSPGTHVVGVDNHSFALERGAKLAMQWADAPSVCRSEDKAMGDDPQAHGGRIKVGANDGEGATNADGGRRACDWLLADLRKAGSLDRVRASVIHGHRFKCEQLLPLLRDEVLLPGGYFIWSTFLDTGTENLVPPWRPSRMLRPGELAGIFSGDNFEILVDEQGRLPTRGSVVPASFFACRKRPSADTYL